MSARHYDVVVLGRSIGALCCAALLARRELRVLVLGQGQRNPLYQVEDYTLARRCFTLLSATSPVFRRILQELAQTQRFRRMTTPLDPMFALLEPRSRFEIPPDVELFSREIRREYPEVEQQVAEFYALVSEANARIDQAFERDAIWPPGTLWERLETGRLSSSLPLIESRDGPASLFERLPEEHAFRRVVELPAFFASHLGQTPAALPTFALARLHGSWTRGVHSLPREEQELEDFLVERIESYGGVCRLRGRASELVIRRGRLLGVQEDGEPWLTGAEAVVSSSTGEALANLTQGAGVTRKAREAWPEIGVVGGRFVVNVVVASEGVPAPLARESFLLGPEPSLPTVHMKRCALPESNGRDGDGPLELLVCESCVTPGIDPLGARAAVLATLERHLPYIARHFRAIDSPHDGLPARLYEPTSEGLRVRELERVHLREASVTAEPMEPRLSVSSGGYLGLSGEPVRGPIPGTYLVGPSVLPALGQEGELLAAWSAARILTKKDRNRQKLRRQMWTKIETS
ncbi:MAG TPA: phytoene dehydrogenase [Polyangiaceae bacterium]|nr:phytoene dehydrogenase [Polyangiaceae bacterium]